MARFKFRRSLRFDNLEGRQLLSSVGQDRPTSSNIASVDQRSPDQSRGRGRSRSRTTSLPMSRPRFNITGSICSRPCRRSRRPRRSPRWPGTPTWQTPPRARASTWPTTRSSRTPAPAARHRSSESRRRAIRISVQVPKTPTRMPPRPMEAMQAFLIDWGVPSDGHRINIQQPGVSPQNAYTDAGVGIVQTNPSNPSFGPHGDHAGLRQAAQFPTPSWLASPTTTTAAPASISPVKGRAVFRSTPSTSRPDRSAPPRPGLPAATSWRFRPASTASSPASMTRSFRPSTSRWQCEHRARFRSDQLVAGRHA